MKQVTANCSNKYWSGLSKGATYTVLNSYHYNGEGHYKVRAGDGTVFEAPDVFFDDK
jgi:hypothetical protein